MSHSSLKEQLQAVASQLSETIGKDKHQAPTSQAPTAQAPTAQAPTAQASTAKSPHKAGHKASQPHKDKAQQHAEKTIKKPKPKWLDYAQYGVELLKVYFPDCFKAGSEVKPLKTGIKQDLLKRLSSIDTIVIEDKACMVKSLAYYVNTVSYHKSVVEGATRIDLDGKAAGAVTAEEAKYSLERQENKMTAKQSPGRTEKAKEEVAE